MDLIQETKSQLRLLDSQRNEIEQEADAITSELTTSPAPGVEAMGVKTPLVDAGGYPRGDIDVYRARELRGRLSALQTDHKQVMKKVEQTLYSLAELQPRPCTKEEKKEDYSTKNNKPRFDKETGKWVLGASPVTEDGAFAGSSSAEESVRPNVTSPPFNNSKPPSAAPFARVNTVAPNSPAQTAGLLPGDLILSIDTLSRDKFNDPMADVAVRVQEAAATVSALPVWVIRKDTTNVLLSLRPQSWEGNGLLGCHILPYP